MVSRSIYRRFRRLRPGPLARTAILGGVILHVGGFALLSVQVRDVTPPMMPRPFASFVDLRDDDAAAVLRQQAVLFDSAPLFVPTRWNTASAIDDVVSLQEAAEVYRAFPEELSLGDDPAIPADFITKFDPIALRDPSLGAGVAAFRRFGQTERETPRLPPRAFSVGARELRSGRAYDFDFERVNVELPTSPWRPAVFYMQLDASGVDGLPTIVESTGFPNFDQRLLDWLRTLEFYRRLPSGYFEITVGP